MQKKAFFFAILIIAKTSISLSAQSKREAKWDEAIQALEKSDFTVKYTSIKDSIESQVADFHRHKTSCRPEEIATVKKGYEQSIEQFDKILNRIKEDFSDPKTREFIARNPDRFSTYLEAELNNALTYYNTNCKSRIDEYVENSTGALGLMELSLVIALGKELWSLWSEKQAKTKGMSSKYFEDHFISQHRLKKWEHY